MKWDPADHPRDPIGRFRSLLAGMADGSKVDLPDGTRVQKRGKDSFRVSPPDHAGKGPSVRSADAAKTDTPDRAARLALGYSAKSDHPRSLGGPTRHPGVKAGVRAHLEGKAGGGGSAAERKRERAAKRREKKKLDASYSKLAVGSSLGTNAAREDLRKKGITDPAKQREAARARAGGGETERERLIKSVAGKDETLRTGLEKAERKKQRSVKTDEEKKQAKRERARKRREAKKGGVSERERKAQVKGERLQREAKKRNAGKRAAKEPKARYKAGDRVVSSTGMHGRVSKVLPAQAGDKSPMYRVKWENGHEGNARHNVLSAAPTKPIASTPTNEKRQGPITADIAKLKENESLTHGEFKVTKRGNTYTLRGPGISGATAHGSADGASVALLKASSKHRMSGGSTKSKSQPKASGDHGATAHKRELGNGKFEYHVGGTAIGPTSGNREGSVTKSKVDYSHYSVHALGDGRHVVLFHKSEGAAKKAKYRYGTKVGHHPFDGATKSESQPAAKRPKPGTGTVSHPKLVKQENRGSSVKSQFDILVNGESVGMLERYVSKKPAYSRSGVAVGSTKRTLWRVRDRKRKVVVDVHINKDQALQAFIRAGHTA